MPKHKITPKMEAMKFKPGQTGNPNGRPRLTAEQRAERKVTIDSVRDVIDIVLTGNVDDLKELIQDPKTSVLKVGIATSILKSVKSGDPTVLKEWVERLVGKIPDVIDVNQNTQISQQVTVIDQRLLRAAIDKLQGDV